jgi:Sec-independent protein translocase protein TatA
MSERKLYEIAIRILGLCLLPEAIRSLAAAIYATLRTGGDPYLVTQATMTGVLFLICLAASVLLIALAPWVANLFSGEDTIGANATRIEASTIVRVGITLIGVYAIVSGLPVLISGVVRIATFASGRSFSGGGSLVTPIVQVAIGAALVGHTRLVPRIRRFGRAVRRFHEETRGIDRSDE